MISSGNSDFLILSLSLILSVSFTEIRQPKPYKEEFRERERGGDKERTRVRESRKTERIKKTIGKTKKLRKIMIFPEPLLY